MFSFSLTWSKTPALGGGERKEAGQHKFWICRGGCTNPVGPDLLLLDLGAWHGL